MECSAIQKRLSAYIEGIISSEERSLIDQHLKSCDECNRSLADLKKTLGYIQDLEEIEPPAWLTQKVMAKIRSEAMPKKGILQRLFYPLHIKLPIQALTAILLTVATIYIFKIIQPEVKLIKPSLEDVAPQVLFQEKDKAVESRKEELVPSKPTEKPIPENKLGALADKNTDVLQAPLSKDDLKPEALSPAQGLKAKADRKEDSNRITVNVKDLEAAIKEIEKVIMQLEGKIIKTESSENKVVLIVRLEHKKLKELINKLKNIGEFKETPDTLETQEGHIEIKVEIVKIPMQVQ